MRTTNLRVVFTWADIAGPAKVARSVVVPPRPQLSAALAMISRTILFPVERDCTGRPYTLIVLCRSNVLLMDQTRTDESQSCPPVIDGLATAWKMVVEGWWGSSLRGRIGR